MCVCECAVQLAVRECGACMAQVTIISTFDYQCFQELTDYRKYQPHAFHRYEP